MSTKTKTALTAEIAARLREVADALSPGNLTDLQVDLLAGRLRDLSTRVAEDHEALQATRRPDARERWVRRDLFTEGDRLYADLVRLEAKAEELRREHRRVGNAFDALDAEVRRGKFGDGTFAVPAQEEKEAELQALRGQYREKWEQLTEVEANIKELRARIRRDFTAVETVGLRPPTDLLFQA